MEVATGSKAPPARHAEGLLLLDKPAGVTSHDMVVAARRAYGERSIGHLGTLDPFATGLLVLLLGRSTRLATFIDTEPKVYEATIRFGAETDTDDSTGTVRPRAAAGLHPERTEGALAVAGRDRSIRAGGRGSSNGRSSVVAILVAGLCLVAPVRRPDPVIRGPRRSSRRGAERRV